MPDRLSKRLKERGINRLRNLRNYTKEDLLKAQNFGIKTFYKLEKIITKYGIHLKEE